MSSHRPPPPQRPYDRERPPPPSRHYDDRDRGSERYSAPSSSSSASRINRRSRSPDFRGSRAGADDSGYRHREPLPSSYGADRVPPPPPRDGRSGGYGARDGYAAYNNRDVHYTGRDYVPPPRESASHSSRDRERDWDRGRDSDRDRERQRDAPRADPRQQRRDEPESRSNGRREGGKETQGTSREKNGDMRKEQSKHDQQEDGEEGDGEEGEADQTEEDMMAAMGFGGFGTTKNNKVEGNVSGSANVKKERTWRQYMNRKGGFNRPLDPLPKGK